MAEPGRGVRASSSRKVCCIFRVPCAHTILVFIPLVRLTAIEHIQSLLHDKSALLSRLDRARIMLGQGHPLLYSDAYSSGKALWERDWDGGKGLMGVHGEEDTDDE